MKQSWLIAEPADDKALEIYKSWGINKFIGSILYSRGIREKNDIAGFISPQFSNLHSPYLLNGMVYAVKRIREALDGGEKIAIFADSDLDGITSLTILHDLLSRCGTVPFIRYPKEKEGYGLTCDIINELISEKITLLITVDSGIRDISEIAYAREKGIDTIITDHHEPDSEFPDAIIINPKMPECHYPFRDLAGVGVAFKLAHALLFSYTNSYNKCFILMSADEEKLFLNYIHNGVLIRSDESDKNALNEIIQREICDDDYLILIEPIPEAVKQTIIKEKPGLKVNSLINISNSITGSEYRNYDEMVNSLLKKFNINPLFYNSHELGVKLFLELQMRSSKKGLERMGWYIALAAVGTIADIMPICGENRTLISYGLESLRLQKGHKGIQAILNNPAPTAKNITWDVAPLLNAPGRLGETGLTVDFFLNSDDEKIPEILSEIEKINRERKRRVAAVTDEIKSGIEKEPEPDNRKLYFYMGSDIANGLAGLIASRIADELKKPVIIAVEETGTDTVKGSGRSYNEFNFFRYVEPLSGMFERIGGHAQAFGFTAKKEKLHDIIDSINNALLHEFIDDRTIKIDAAIDINEITSRMIDSLSILEPFGKCNEEPVFTSRNVVIDSFSRFGNGNNHGRFVLNNGIHAIGWNMGNTMEFHAGKKMSVDIVYKMENNTYMNRTFPRLVLIDIDFHQILN